MEPTRLLSNTHWNSTSSKPIASNEMEKIKVCDNVTASMSHSEGWDLWGYGGWEWDIEENTVCLLESSLANRFFQHSRLQETCMLRMQSLYLLEICQVGCSALLLCLCHTNENAEKNYPKGYFLLPFLPPQRQTEQDRKIYSVTFQLSLLLQTVLQCSYWVKGYYFPPYLYCGAVMHSNLYK